MKPLYIRIYGLVLLWTFLTILLGLFSPDIDMLVRKHGQFIIPEDYPTQIADNLLQDNEGFSGEEILLVYKHENNALDYKDEIEKTLSDLNQAEFLDIHSIISPFEGQTQKKLLVSESQNFLIVIIEVNMETSEISFIRDDLEGISQIDDLELYITGSTIIDDDVLSTTEDRLGAIEYFTVALVYIVLLIVFRSPIAPLIP
ncbi:hypothetical protein SYNTR_0175 [Candidatus Syntrophocurvum alkaliphilum]|uniref:Membrane transport protein MMPL domain-containing protein n=1 Tax=Candidatus Syntrophocurvum alkaliphilum TaxID=2293317 RepID=A0A6I6DDU3_9FIRM|nr:hypothetical protein SYNTR_0175 [Candidatus Syntrophocurvum alkaliphilum]